MKTTMILAVLITLIGFHAFAEDNAQQKANAKTPVTYEQTMKNYANKTKEVKKDLDKASQERQQQLDSMEKRTDADTN
jgi:hypothetical protein